MPPKAPKPPPKPKNVASKLKAEVVPRVKQVALEESLARTKMVATQGAAVVAASMRSNLKTLPPLMFNPAVQIANVCLSARDAHHDGNDAGSIQTNPLFINVQQKMFGADWARRCELTFGSQGGIGAGNGTWLSSPHGDIFWTRVAKIKQGGNDSNGDIVPRFGMKLESYSLEACIRAVNPVVDVDSKLPFLFYIVDNLDRQSPTKRKPTAASTSYRSVTISEIFDRAGRSIYGIDRLARLKQWWAEWVEHANSATGTYPPIIIPLDLVGEITIAGSVLYVSLFLDNLVRFDGFKSDETMRFDMDGIHGIVKAVLLYRFHIPGVTDDGVPGVVNIGTVEQPIFTYDTYVFMHNNGSVSYSKPVNSVNYPDNREKNNFYKQNASALKVLTAAEATNLINKGILYNICKSIGDSCAVWTASVKTFIHTTDTGLILRCMFNDRYCIISITAGRVTTTYLVSPQLAEGLFGVFGEIPKSPRPLLPEDVSLATPLATPLTTPLATGIPSFRDVLLRMDKVKTLPNTARPKQRSDGAPFTLTLRERVRKPGVVGSYRGRGGGGIQHGGASFKVPDNTDTNTPLKSLLGDAYKKVIFKGKQITDQDKTLAELGIEPGSQLMIFETKKGHTVSYVTTVAANVDAASHLLEISSDACRYFQTLLLYIKSFYSDTPADAGGIDNFALPESKDVVVVFTDDVSNYGVSNVVANPFQDNVVTKPVVKFISFTELPPKIQEFLTFLKAFVKVFVSNIALITNIEIPPKQRLIQETPMTTSVEGYDGNSGDDVDMEIKLNIIRTIISRILGNRGGDSGEGSDSEVSDDGGYSGINGIQTDLREVSRACLLPSVLLRIDDPNIKKGYLDAYNTSKASTPGTTSSNDLGVPNFFYLPNATSNVFDIIDNIVGYFGPVFSKSYDDSGIVFEKLPDIFPHVKADVFKALEQFKRDNRLYTIPMQIKFNTHAISSAKIFDNLCKIINGKPLSDPSNSKLKEYIEKRLSTEIEKLEKLKTLAASGKSVESGEGNSSLSEEIRNNIEATARDNILSDFTAEMANYFVDGEMEDFEKDSMKALIDLNATYGFDVQGNDYLHLNDIVYKIFVQEIMYTGAHIYRVDFLQDFINNIGFNTGQLNYMDNINDALAANGTISNEQLTELKIKGYSLSDIIGLLYELRDKTTESSSEEEVTSVVNGFFGQEVSSLPKVMKTGIGIGSIPSQPITVDRTLVSVGKGGRGGHKIKTRSKYVAKRRVMYKKFVRKYIIKADKRGNRGTQGGKRRSGANVTRRKILKRSRVSNNNATRKNHKKIHKKIHKIHKKKNTNLRYNLHKRHKTLKR
jgi:hypothetical protein